MPYKIREVRIEMNLTQEQLSEKSGVSRATISALENGKAEITTTDTLLKLAKALNRRVSDIFLA